MFEDNMVLQRKEMTDLTALVANIIYDVYYTQCYVRINKERNSYDQQPTALSQDDADDIFKKTEELLKQFSFKREADKVMELYNHILEEDRGLLFTEQNITDMISLVIADCDQPLDIGPCIMHYNSFVDEDTSEVQTAMDGVIDLFDNIYMEHNLKDFIFLCQSAMPLIVRYVINELEVCDLLKPLGEVDDVKVYYINVESKPTPPLGYSKEFSYPLIPYRMIGYINTDGVISPSVKDSVEHVYTQICDMNIYKFDYSEEYVNILVQIRSNEYLNDFDDNEIILQKGISLTFKDYLKLFMAQDVSEFFESIIAVTFNS